MTESLVDVGGGIRLAIRTTGAGSPPVVCLSCSGGAHDEWAAVASELQDVAQVITYGRPTLGGSDPLPPDLAKRTQTVAWTAAQLHTLLQRAGIKPPYVLATSSIGSWIADRVAAQWPDEVAGIVLVDPTNHSPWPEDMDRWAEILDGGDEGCIRWSRDDSYAELARSVPSTPARAVVVSSSDGRWQRKPPPERYDFWSPRTLADVDRLWQGFQRDWVERLNAVHVVATTAGHFVHREEPGLVALTIRAVVEAARADHEVRLDPGAVTAANGRLVTAPR